MRMKVYKHQKTQDQLKKLTIEDLLVKIKLKLIL